FSCCRCIGAAAVAVASTDSASGHGKIPLYPLNLGTRTMMPLQSGVRAAHSFWGTKKYPQRKTSHIGCVVFRSSLAQRPRDLFGCLLQLRVERNEPGAIHAEDGSGYAERGYDGIARTTDSYRDAPSVHLVLLV